MARAKTGSGKTGAYSIPIVQLLLSEKQNEVKFVVINHQQSDKGTKVVILVPTRELTEQLRQHFKEVTYYCNNLVKTVALTPEVDFEEQAYGRSHFIYSFSSRLREKPDIVVSTPAKLLQHIQAKV